QRRIGYHYETLRYILPPAYEAPETTLTPQERLPARLQLPARRPRRRPEPAARRHRRQSQPAAAPRFGVPAHNPRPPPRRPRLAHSSCTSSLPNEFLRDDQ